jgi:hypothetical protein
MIFESEITHIEGIPYYFEYKIFNEDGNLIDINFQNKDFFKFEILHKGKIILSILIVDNPFQISLPSLFGGFYNYRVSRNNSEVIQFGRINIIPKLQ